MNEVLHCLLTRRSVKKYLSQPVEEEKLEAVLEAGTYAACGMGRQAGKIVVLQNPDDIAQLEKMNATILGNPDARSTARRSYVSCSRTRTSTPGSRTAVLSSAI